MQLIVKFTLALVFVFVLTMECELAFGQTGLWRKRCHRCHKAFVHKCKTSQTRCQKNSGEESSNVSHLAAEQSLVNSLNEPLSVSEIPREVSAFDPTEAKKARATGGYLGAVTEARFYAEHSMIFNNVKHALDLYNAIEGRYPSSHDEFMNEVIRENSISLPELDPGVEYIYDPEDHKLKIWQPADTETAPVAIEEES